LKNKQNKLIGAGGAASGSSAVVKTAKRWRKLEHAIAVYAMESGQGGFPGCQIHLHRHGVTANAPVK
jgi:hypothetical protein